MRKEIVLPPHLYDRIKASAGEHGGIGQGKLFADNHPDLGIGAAGAPFCVHGHAWGTCTRYQRNVADGSDYSYSEPELGEYLHFTTNDAVLDMAGIREGVRVPFDHWCELLNVKRGVEVPVAERELVSAA